MRAIKTGMEEWGGGGGWVMRALGVGLPKFSNRGVNFKKGGGKPSSFNGVTAKIEVFVKILFVNLQFFLRLCDFWGLGTWAKPEKKLRTPQHEKSKVKKYDIQLLYIICLFCRKIFSKK